MRMRAARRSEYSELNGIDSTPAVSSSGAAAGSYSTPVQLRTGERRNADTRIMTKLPLAKTIPISRMLKFNTRCACNAKPASKRPRPYNQPKHREDHTMAHGRGIHRRSRQI